MHFIIRGKLVRSFCFVWQFPQFCLPSTPFMFYSAATPHRFKRRNTAAPFLENYSAEMVHRLGLGRNRKSSGKRVFWIRVQMKRFMAALDLAFLEQHETCSLANSLQHLRRGITVGKAHPREAQTPTHDFEYR